MTRKQLRYGHFYGPGTYYANDAPTAADVRQGHYPIVDQWPGTCSFVQIEDTAMAWLQADCPWFIGYLYHR